MQFSNRKIALEEQFKFKGELIPYQRSQNFSKWGGFYIKNPKRSGRPRFLHPPGPCPFCRLSFDLKDPMIFGTIEQKENKYLVAQNHNPIVEEQRLLFPLPITDPHLNQYLSHRIDLNATDVAIIIELVTNGFSNLGLKYIESSNKDGTNELDTQPWAVYVNTFPGTGRSVPHLHINCVPARYVPLLEADVVSWQVCQDKNTIFSRLDINFYALAVSGDRTAIPQTLEFLHNKMNEWEIPYNLIAYPLPKRPDEIPEKLEGETESSVRIVVVPRDLEYCEAADQKIGGLEFLTGVLIPGKSRQESMSTIQRNLAFYEGTLKEVAQLKLERRLRKFFGMPHLGLAVYPEKFSSAFTCSTLNSEDISESIPDLSQAPTDPARIPKYKPLVQPNFPDNLDFLPDWQFTVPEQDGPVCENCTKKCDTMRLTPNVLVRITRASICQSDRRVLLGTKGCRFDERALVLGHEAGGYIVDPGPWTSKLKAGEKVVILPHLTCGKCRFCHSYMQNLCSNMLHLGFHIHGTLANLVSFPYQCIIPVDSNFPDDALPLVEPMACVLRLFFRIKDQMADLARDVSKSDVSLSSFTIYGAGPMGCLAAKVVKRFWPDIRVQMVEPILERMEMVQHLNIADDIVGIANKKHHIGFVASSKLQASLDTIEGAQNGGLVILFSGINTDEKSLYPEKALHLEKIHREEWDVVVDIPLGKCYRLLGSSGYNFDDAVRSIQELSSHYEHYAQIQNLEIQGLDATEAFYRIDSKLWPLQDKWVEVLLSPAGVYDSLHGAKIAKVLKPLIKL